MGVKCIHLMHHLVFWPFRSRSKQCSVWPHPMYASSTNLSRKWGHKKFCIENICRSFKLYPYSECTYEIWIQSCILRLLTQLTAYMLSHTLKSLAIDDAMYASESYWELCVRYIRVLFGKPIFQSKYMAKIQNLKNVCTYIHFLYAIIRTKREYLEVHWPLLS